MWAVGCLLVEAAVGEALFPSESEIEHLFKVAESGREARPSGAAS